MPPNQRKKVHLIPFLLVAGMHFHKDLMGKQKQSWLSRFTEAGLEVSAAEEGLGMLPGIGELLADHVADALELLPR